MRLMAVALRVIAAVSVLSLCSGEADFSDSMVQPVVLSAEEFQNDIIAIDRLAFDEKPFDEAHRKFQNEELRNERSRTKNGELHAQNDSLGARPDGFRSAGRAAARP